MTELMNKVKEAMKTANDEITHIVVWNFENCEPSLYYVKMLKMDKFGMVGIYAPVKEAKYWNENTKGSFPTISCDYFEIPEKTQVYLAGDMLNRGAQMQRNAEKDEIVKAGFGIYNPQDNEAINDKENAVQDGLAERIVKHDTNAIIESDIVVIEPLQHAIGTCAELGQIHGIKLAVRKILDMFEDDSKTSDEILQDISDFCIKQENKLVLPHHSDIRRTDIPEVGDRRSFGMHQYILGLCLELTQGKGMYEWNEVMETLKEF